MLGGFVRRPAGEDGRDHLDVGIVLQRFGEAFVAIRVGGHPVDAAHLDDIALAAELLEQRLGAKLAVGLLIIGHDIGGWSVDRLVDRHNDNSAIGRLLDDGIKRLAIGRVDDDDIRAGRDQIADVGDLLRRSAVAVGENDFGNLARREGLGLDRADHLLTPAVANEGV